MSLNKPIACMLTLLLILNNVLPVGAVDGEKRTTDRRRNASSASPDNGSDDADFEMVDSDMESFSLDKDASDIDGTPTKKRRLLNTGCTDKQSEHQIFEKNKILVMKLGVSDVKSFNSILEARKWLQNNGWKFVTGSNIIQAMRKSYWSYGWKWEVKFRTKKLNDLLEVEPTPEQIKEAKSHIRKSREIGFDSSAELLVMSLNGKPVKTFASNSEAKRWLQMNGWELVGYSNIIQAIRKSGLSCGWEWEIRDKSETLEKLLEVEPTEEQVKEAKDRSKKRPFVNSINFIVMKLGNIEIKAFTNEFDAVVWLKKNGWECARGYRIRQAIQRSGLYYGWNWEFEDKSEALETLLRAEPTQEQIEEARDRSSKKTFSSIKLIVMKLGDSEIKAFTNEFDAVIWLKKNGWERAEFYSIRQAIRKVGFYCGWKWEIQARTKTLEDLLETEPTVEQIKEAKNCRRKQTFCNRAEQHAKKGREIPAEPFANFSEEERCLQSGSGGKSSSTNIDQVEQRPQMLSELNQEAQDETEEQEDLLIVEPLPNQADKTRNGISISSLINSTQSMDSQTQRPLELGRSSCPNIDQVEQRPQMLSELNQEAQDETEEQEDLLIEELPSDQAGKTRNGISISSLINGTQPMGMKTWESFELSRSGCSNIDQVVIQPHMLCGLDQKAKDETEKQEDLLIVEPLPNQANKTKNGISISSLIDNTQPVEEKMRESSGLEEKIPTQQSDCFYKFDVCRPSGLVNTKNQCFLNAVMQQLYRLKKFRDCVLETEVLESENLIQYCLKRIFESMRYGCTDITDISDKLRMAIFCSDSTQEDISDLIYKVCGATQENTSELRIGVKFIFKDLPKPFAPIWVIDNDSLSQLQTYLDRGFVDQMIRIAELGDDVLLRVAHGQSVAERVIPQEFTFKEDDYKLSGGITYIGFYPGGLSGHYISYVKEGDKWFEINDTMIKIMPFEKVKENLNQNGCLLRYTKLKK